MRKCFDYRLGENTPPNDVKIKELIHLALNENYNLGLNCQFGQIFCNVNL